MSKWHRIPENPTISDWHWIKHNKKNSEKVPYYWCAEAKRWGLVMEEPDINIGMVNFSYLGPCYTREDLEAEYNSAYNFGYQDGKEFG